jgi:hypothetical protein
MLGKTVVDSITGFTGMAIGHVEYVTGCNQTLVQPRCKPDGDFVESRWMDDERLAAIPGAEVDFGPGSGPVQPGTGSDKEAPRR